MTYTNIPPISYIFVGITTAILSYVTWAEMQENTEDEPEQLEESEPVEEPQQLEESEPVEEHEEPLRPVEQNVIGGKKRHSKTKRKRTNKNKKKTKHAKLNLK